MKFPETNIFIHNKKATCGVIQTNQLLVKKIEVNRSYQFAEVCLILEAAFGHDTKAITFWNQFLSY